MDDTIRYNLSKTLCDKLYSLTTNQLQNFDYPSFDYWTSTLYPALLNDITIKDFKTWSTLFRYDDANRICLDEPPSAEMSESFKQLVEIYLENENKKASDLQSLDEITNLTYKLLFHVYTTFNKYKLSSIVAFIYFEILELSDPDYAKTLKSSSNIKYGIL